MATNVRGQARGAPTDDRYRIGELVELTDTPATSIHHYLKLGLLPQPERPASNRFLYDGRHVTALRLIRAMRARGLDLGQIECALPELMSGSHDGASIESAIDAYLVKNPADSDPRSRLVEAAVMAFANEGYRTVSVAHLCNSAGIAKGSFYRYFEDKDELFVAAAGSVVERAVNQFERDLEAGSDEAPHVLFADHLRPGIPVLLELAKRSTQDSGELARSAAELFAGLADRLGALVAGDDIGYRRGGQLIILSVIEIFTDLVRPALLTDTDG